MAAQWESSDNGGIEAAETGSGLAVDTYDIDPDIENYANGTTPDTPNGGHGSPDNHGDQHDHISDVQHDGDEQDNDSHADASEETARPEDTETGTDPADEWGDTDPDAENYAGLDGPDPQQSPYEDRAGTGRDISPDTSQPGQDQPSQAEAERTVSPEQQRISALESENADAKQQIAELRAANDEQATRMERIEQLLADRERRPDSPDGSRVGELGHVETHDVPDNKHNSAITEREGTRQGGDSKEAQSSRWRRAASAENVGIAGSLAGAADTVAQFAMHATPEGVVGLGATILGLASLGIAKAEKHRKGKP